MLTTPGGRMTGQLLSTRERDVLQLVAAGMPDREIGDRLFISPKTVEKHVTRARLKLGARSRIEAVLAALRMDLIPWPAAGAEDASSASPGDDDAEAPVRYRAGRTS